MSEFFQAVAHAAAFVRPVLDVVILAFIIYKLYDILAKSQAALLVNGALYLALIYALAYLLQLSTLQWILGKMAPGLFIALAIVFQPEIRKIITRLGLTEFFKPNTKPRLGQLEPVVTAAEILSEQRMGMLVVFQRKTNLKHIQETGTCLNADISSSLLQAIFLPPNPLHDGATVIVNGRIAAAGCFLPLSEQQDIRKTFGTRHRAALGMSENSDAVVLVVSEETGAISLAYDGQLFYDLPQIMVQQKLRSLLDKQAMTDAAAESETAENGRDA